MIGDYIGSLYRHTMELVEMITYLMAVMKADREEMPANMEAKIQAQIETI
jgi:hypothetical protein